MSLVFIPYIVFTNLIIATLSFNAVTPIIVTNLDTNHTRTIVTDEDGWLEFDARPHDRYMFETPEHLRYCFTIPTDDDGNGIEEIWNDTAFECPDVQ